MKFGDIEGSFLTQEEANLFSKMNNAPLGFSDYGGFPRHLFKEGSGEFSYRSPQFPPIDVLSNPDKYNVAQNIADILAGNNRSGFSPQTINTVKKSAGSNAPFSASESLIAQIIAALQMSNNQGFIKTPPEGKY